MSEQRPDSPAHEIVLEIGVGANDFHPMPTMLVGYDNAVPPHKFTGNRRYIGIDMPLDPGRSWRNMHLFFTGGDVYFDDNSRQSSGDIALSLGGVRQILLDKYRPGENIDFMVADGQQLPFPDSSITEVYMGNVVGSQMLDSEVGNLLQEVSRVVRAGGMLMLREDITPQHVPDNLTDLLHGVGFGNIAQHMRGSNEHTMLQGRYGVSPGDLEDHAFTGEHYFLVAARSNPQGGGKDITV